MLGLKEKGGQDEEVSGVDNAGNAMKHFAEDSRRNQFLAALHRMADFWIAQPATMLPSERVNGVVFSILAEIDGVGSLPPVDVVVDGVVINRDLFLHDLWYTVED